MTNLTQTPLRHSEILEKLNYLTDKYNCLSVTCLGLTDVGNVIPIITLGQGAKGLMYIGRNAGASGILMRFSEEYCQSYATDNSCYGCSVPYLYSTECLYIVPTVTDNKSNDSYIDNILRNFICFNDGIRCVTELSCDSDDRYLSYNPNSASESLYRRAKKLTAISNTHKLSDNLSYSAECGKSVLGIGIGNCTDRNFFENYFLLRELLFKFGLFI